MIGMWHILLVCIALFPQPGNDRAEGVLLQFREQITSAATAFDISPRLLASMIYAEHKLNVMPGESVLDVVFARTGYNSSLGVAQIKIETAFWIQSQVRDRDSRFYLGDKYAEIIRASKSRGEMIDRLTDPQENLMFAAAYVSIIERTWRRELDSPWSIPSKVGIIATIYSLGLVRPDGTVREPHARPEMNELGRVSQNFNDSLLLLAAFPR